MIEKTQKSGNLSQSLNYLENGNEKEKLNDKIEYLNKNSSYQIRELYDKNGNKINAKDGIKISQNYKYFDIKIYNPVTDNLSKNDLHNMAKDIFKLREKFSNQKIDGVYAIHYRPDGTNKHIHIAYFFNDKKSFEKAKGTEWNKALAKLEGKYVIFEKDKQKIVELYNKSLQTLKSRKTGTEKIDNFIKTHMNKQNGNFSLQRAIISIQKSKTIHNKSYYIRRLKGRLNNLSKLGIAKKIDEKNYKIDIEKFEKMIKEREFLKIEKHKLILEKGEIKEKINSLQQDKQKILKDINFKYTTLKINPKQYRVIKFQIKQLEKNLNEISKQQEIEKLKAFDYQLAIKGKINVYKGAEWLIKNTKLDLNVIKDITKRQIERLEQLRKLGLVEKKGNTYQVKNKKEFIKYIKSQKADKDREKLAEKRVYNKALSKKIDNFIKRQTKITPIRTWSKTYKTLSKAFGHSLGDKILAFTIATAISIGANALKAIFKVTYSLMKGITKGISKNVFKSKIKNNTKQQTKSKEKNIKSHSSPEKIKDKYEDEKDKKIHFISDKELEKESSNKKENNNLKNDDLTQNTSKSLGK